MEELTLKHLKSRVTYHPETGVFTHARTSGRARLGGRADRPFVNGYRQIAIDRRTYLAHRLAWFWVHGQWPKHTIDHIDGDRANNKLSNLREATIAQNTANMKRTRRGPELRGVRKVGNRWRAEITKGGTQHHLGYFDTREMARSVYDAASARFWGEYSYANARAI